MNTKQPKTLYELCDESKSHARKRSRNNDNSGSLLRKKAKLPRSQNLSKVEHKQQTLECGASIPIRYPDTKLQSPGANLLIFLCL